MSHNDLAFAPRDGRVLVLRVCSSEMISHGGFTWPKSGHVECSDWSTNSECGNGLHGWLWGEGNGDAHGQTDPWRAEARWLVVDVEALSVVRLGDKVKFPCGEVVF